MIGQEFVDRVNYRLAGYANSVSYLSLLDFVNEAANEVWGVLKSLNEDYFLQFSQNTNSSNPYYFPPLVPGTREYTLPADFKAMRWIEPTTPGYTDEQFILTTPSKSDFRNARQSANQSPTNGNVNASSFLYCVIGTNTISFADYFPTTINVTLWYVRGIPRFEATDPVPDIIDPFATKAVDYVVQKVMLANQDVAQFNTWKEEWRNDVIFIAQDGGTRNQANASFVEDFGSSDDGIW